jgi:hypothetical protein
MAKPEAPESPAELFDRSRQLHAQGDELEEQALRAAFLQSRWLEAPAAKLLGIPRSSLRALLKAKRYEKLRAEIVAGREAEGYRRGLKLSDMA